MAHKNKKKRPSLLTRSSRSTIRRTTSPPADSSTAGSQEPKKWEASSAATSLGRLGDTGPTSASRGFSSPTTTIGPGYLGALAVCCAPTTTLLPAERWLPHV